MSIEFVNGLWVPSNDIHINQWKSGKPFTQNKCLNKFLNFIKIKNQKFNTVLDIGAWCGTWSIALSSYCKKIIAFEPDDTHFNCFLKNTEQYQNINVYNCAVGDKKTSVSLTADDFTQAKRVNSAGNIQMNTIDSYNFTDVDLMKIDVEGFEMNVLKGSIKTLKSLKFLMIELNNNSKKYNSSNVKIEKFLQENNFTTLIDKWPDKVFVRNN